MAQFLSRFVSATGALPDVAQTRADVARLRPGLLERFDAAVPQAMASVLARLLGALDREPLPGLVRRDRDGRSGLLRVTFAGGTEVIFPTAAAQPFATPETWRESQSATGQTAEGHSAQAESQSAVRGQAVDHENGTDQVLLEATVIADLDVLSLMIRPGEAPPEDSVTEGRLPAADTGNGMAVTDPQGTTLTAEPDNRVASPDFQSTTPATDPENGVQNTAPSAEHAAAKGPDHSLTSTALRSTTPATNPGNSIGVPQNTAPGAEHGTASGATTSAPGPDTGVASANVQSPTPATEKEVRSATPAAEPEDDVAPIGRHNAIPARGPAKRVTCTVHQSTDPGHGTAEAALQNASQGTEHGTAPTTLENAAPGPENGVGSATLQGAAPGAEKESRKVGDPGALARMLWPGAGLAAELDNSVANLALALAAQPDTDGPEWTLAAAEGDPDGLARLEQLVLDGHPLHPCCRTREGMTTADVLAYAPEHRKTIRLRKLAVPPDRWAGDGPPILYAHPWQAARLMTEHPWLTDAGETLEGRPLMSLRTVALPGEHVKTAVDVRMTSAVRTVSAAAIHNGPPLSALLTELTHDLPLDVLAETGAGAVLVDGEPQRRMAHLRREAPRPQEGEAIVPLGALKAGRPPLISQAVDRAGGDPYRWMVDLAEILWPSLMVVLDRGVALEAHGQNTLVGLVRGKPTRILYRDFGGVRVKETAMELEGDLPCDDPAELRAKLAAACFGTVALEVVTLLAEHHHADPLRLWGIIAESVERSGTEDAEAMLRDPLPLKATTAMRLAAEPLDDVWCHLDNPMAGAR